MSNPANIRQSTLNPKPSQRRKKRIRPAPERFWEKVAKTNSCWFWKGSQSTAGYGTFNLGRSGDGYTYAHRFSFELVNGPIPEGLELDHLCRVRNCVNPNHLEAVTRKENYERGFSPSAIIMRSGKCKRGHDWTTENTYIWPQNPNRRFCRECRRIRRAQK